MAKNQDLLSGIAARVNQRHEPGAQQGNQAEPQGTEGQGPLAANIAGITNPRAPGGIQSKIQKSSLERQVWVDPAKCRPWVHHNRDYALLDEKRCAELIAGFRSLGKQQRPAIVRTLKDADADGDDGRTYDFEIISGARRHWVVSWLREKEEVNADGQPYWFLVVVRDDLDSIAAFELSDAENRGQKDISDFERAREYHWALKSLYEGNVLRMAEAIEMERSKLTRLLALTEMPEPIVKAYPTILDIRTHHWRQLGSYFSSKEHAKQEAAERILACARSIVEAREERSRNVPGDGAETAAMLLAAARDKRRGGDRTQVLQTIHANATGKMAVTIKRTTRSIKFDVSIGSGATKEEIHEALRKGVDDYFDA
jgi:ParB family chromosome partitioning protein